MRAMILKELRQLRRDRRTLAMMVVLPVLLLVVFGYAASFDVEKIEAEIVGPRAARVADRLPDDFEITAVDRRGKRGDAVAALREGRVPVVFIAGRKRTEALLDGSDIFTAQAARAELAKLSRREGLRAQRRNQRAVRRSLARLRRPHDAARPPGQAASGRPAPTTAPPPIEAPRLSLARPPKPVDVDTLFNAELATSAIMVPGLAGLILLFIGTVITSLGVVRERQAGTLEQLAVMPLRPRDVFLGKLTPYFLVALVDLAVVLTVGVLLFDVPFSGSPWVLALGAVLFLFVTLGVGVLISSVSDNQGQAIQLALMTLLPQILLSGLIFPLESMAPGVRWLSYLLPLTWFIAITRGVMLRDAPLEALAEPLAILGLLGAAVVLLATLRFRRDLAPAPSRGRPRGRRRPAATGAQGA